MSRRRHSFEPFCKWLFFAFLLLTAGCSATQQAGDKWDGFTESGQASFYGDRHQDQKTANGEIYRHELNTAAHRTLPFGTNVKVTNIGNGKSVVVKINDRGPFVKGRIIDLSKSAFASIGKTSGGLIDVRIDAIVATAP